LKHKLEQLEGHRSHGRLDTLIQALDVFKWSPSIEDDHNQKIEIDELMATYLPETSLNLFDTLQNS
jgi:hypothetical protein